MIILQMKVDLMMKTLNYHKILLHLVRIELFDGKVYEGEILGKNHLGFQLKVLKKGITEYVIVNESAIKSLKDLGFV